MRPGDDDYVEVRDEPLHRHRFANRWASVYDVLVLPGETTLFHRHAEDTLYVSISSATVVRQVLGEEATAASPTVACGVSYCGAFRDAPLVHRITNVDHGPMRMIGAELLGSPDQVMTEELDLPAHGRVWEAPRLRAYELQLEPGETTGDIDYPFTGLTIAVTQASLLVHDRGGPERTVVSAAGGVVWHHGPLSTCITNIGPEPYRAVVAEWR